LDSSDSLDMLAGGSANPNDVFEQPLPGANKPRVAAGGGMGGMGGMDNPPSPSSDALGNEMKRYPHQQPQQYPNNAPPSYQQGQPQQRQNNSYPSNEPPSQSPYKSKFMQQYDDQGQQQRPPVPTSQPPIPTTSLADEADSNFLGSLRSDNGSATGGGWNDDTSNVDIPSLAPPKRKVSYRRRKATDNPDGQYPPTPTFSSNRKLAPRQSQSQDPSPWNSDNVFDPDSVPPSHMGNRGNAKSTPTSMTDDQDDQGFLGNQTAPRQGGGDIGHARSRLSLLKTKMRRSDSGSNLMRPNNGEATNLPNNSPKQKLAPPHRQQQQQQYAQAESGWNNDISDSYDIPEVPQPQQQRQQQQYAQAESGWNNDISDTPMAEIPEPKANRRRQPQQQQQQQPRRQQQQQQQQQSRWDDSSQMADEVGSSSLPGSAAASQRKPARQAAPRAQPQQQQQQRQQPPPQQYQQPPPQQQQQYQQQQQQLPPDAYPPSDPFAAGNESAPGGPQKQCPDCGRKFNPSPYEKHIKICAKVFVEKRKAFDSKKMRIESVAQDNPEIVKVLNEKAEEDRRNKKKGGKQNAAPQSERAIAAASKKAKWKAESEAFRAAMRAGKEVSNALATGGPMPEQTVSAPDPSLVPCPNCGRSFNEQAAERHIPLCKNIRAKPTSLKRGTGGAGGKNGTIAKPKQPVGGAKRR
jgi:hypothetical protein